MFLVRARVLMRVTALVVLVGTAPWNPSTAQATDSTKVVVKDFMFSPTTSTVQSRIHGDLD